MVLHFIIMMSYLGNNSHIHSVLYKIISLICNFRRHCIADQQSIVRFAMPLSTSMIASEVCCVDSFDWRYAGSLQGEKSLENLSGKSLTILDNLW